MGVRAHTPLSDLSLRIKTGINGDNFWDFVGSGDASKFLSQAHTAAKDSVKELLGAGEEYMKGLSGDGITLKIWSQQHGMSYHYHSFFTDSILDNLTESEVQIDEEALLQDRSDTASVRSGMTNMTTATVLTTSTVLSECIAAEQNLAGFDFLPTKKKFPMLSPQTHTMSFNGSNVASTKRPGLVISKVSRTQSTNIVTTPPRRRSPPATRRSLSMSSATLNNITSTITAQSE